MNIRKILLLLLLFILLGCHISKQDIHTSEEKNNLYSLDDTSLIFDKEIYDELYIDIQYSNSNTSKIIGLDYPFECIINNANPDSTNVLFKDDFNVIVYHKGKAILRYIFHNNNQLTIDSIDYDDITYTLDKLPFKEDISINIIDTILNNAIYLDSILPKNINKIDILYGIDDTTHCTIKLKNHEELINRLLSTKLDDYKQDESTSYALINTLVLGTSPLSHFSLKITDNNNNTRVYGDGWNNTFTYKFNKYKTQYFTLNDNIIYNNIKHYLDDLYKFKKDNLTYYLKPIYYENEYITITSEAVDIEALEAAEPFNDVVLKYRNYDLTAYENNEIITNFILDDNNYHIIHFKDQNNNIFEYYYNNRN